MNTSQHKKNTLTFYY